ncbi:putative receptor-like protein kinase [Nicotiana attenuata]|uniref:Receptor-like protein kinase n=1 Tax=Nicotiana attenuata TaxID=49451 RepID=A0A1J6IBN3_NICAT|nr:putative receptor-like protein kinase [Nicotiana attenuata]
MNLGNLQQLQFISLQLNQLTNDPSMRELSFLSSLSNCKYLKTVQIGGNQFNASLPKFLGSGNWSFSLEYFTASNNGITGKIPTNFTNLRNLEWLSLGYNKLIGKIPPDLGNLRKLQKLKLDNNNIDGIIPISLCNMENLFLISLSQNQLSGEVPSCFGNLSSLRELYLDSNALISSIQPTFWRNKDISVVNLSSNFLNGSLALEMGNSRSLQILHSSGNQFSGQIPSTIGQLQNLVILSLSMNMLDSPIPKSFEDLVSLEYLDLSSNKLSGMYFNISYNGLMGEIPDGGPFVNFTAESFMGNPALCGASRFHVMQCRVSNPKRPKKKRVVTFVLASVASGVAMTTIFIVWLLKYRKRSRELPLVDTFGQVHRRISYQDIAQGTNNFDEANLIGRGSLGLVYKGTLADGKVVAIKVFNAEMQHAFRSFDVECQVLRSIRHRNLVKVISSCANFDYKVLVLEYMPNENLDRWLHSPEIFLDLTQRLKVMVDVASAMEYLHGDHLFVVVHCDLKPSNKLLDGDMVAKVSDFGISKLLTADTLIAHTKTLGTIGYMAPAQQLDLRASMDQMHQQLKEDMDHRQIELVQLVSALKSSLEGMHLHQQAKDGSSTSTDRTHTIVTGQGILGPNPHYVANNRNHNLVFPRFNGENLKNWLYRIEQYFAMDNTPLNERVRLVVMNLDDEALASHQAFLKCRGIPGLPEWEEYLAVLVETFGDVFADPMLELKQLKQTGSVLLPKQMFIIDLEYPEGEIEEDPVKSEGTSPTEEWTVPDIDPPLISLCALRGLKGAQTIHVIGYSNKRPIQILLDGGSTHNFIDVESAQRLGANIMCRRESLKTASSQALRLNKSCSEEVQFFMLQVVSPTTMMECDSHLNALHFPVEEPLPDTLQDLLEQYQILFREPTSLPPQRGVFDHRIPPQEGSKPINIRPYRYSSMKKDIIEKLVLEMLQKGVSTDPNKILAVQQWHVPTTLKQLRGFLGLAGYYRKFIKNYGLISQPLTELLKKDSFKWSTSADGIGIGAVLMHEGHPVAFISKGLAPRHAALSVYERELLALVFVVSKWSHYLMGQHFIIRTDQKALKYLLEQKIHTDSQIKWIAKLLPFDFEIQYKKGRENIAADSLSRVKGAELMSLVVSSVSTELWEEITASWSSDPELHSLILSLQQAPQKHLTRINHQLRRKGKLVIGNDVALQTKLLTLWHSTPTGGHSRLDATTRKADAHRSDKSFNVGDWVFVKLQPYRQSTLAGSPYHKLTSRYFGPYPIVENIGVVAYKLILPQSHLCPVPEAVLARRLIKKENKAVAQCLVKWSNLDASYATWELASALRTHFPAFTLEDKGDLQQGGIDTHISATSNVEAE